MKYEHLSIIAGVLIILAIPNLPYGYYILLRWAVTAIAIILIFQLLELNNTSWILIFGTIAFIFNPIIPVHLDKGTWVIIDLISALVFFSSYNYLKKELG